MCATQALPAKDICASWTDMEPIQLLSHLQEGSSLPSSVIHGVNPFQLDSSNLPVTRGDIWYLVIVPLEGSEQTKGKVWKEISEPCLIHTKNSLTGWTRTHEFHEGPPPTADGCKSRWMMKEYWISSGDSINRKGSSSLCRVFLCDDGEDGNTGLFNKDVTEAIPDKDSKTGQAPISAAQVEMARGDECFNDYDMICLDDLDTSSSDNSSFFDPEDILEEIDRGDEAYSQPRAVSYQLNVSRPSDDLVLFGTSADTFAASPELNTTISTQSVRVGEPVVPSEPIMVEGWVAISAPNRGLPDKDCSNRKGEVPASSSSGDPGAPSCSDNLSFFDPEALLEEIDHGDEAYSQPRAVSYQLNVSGSSDDVDLYGASAASPEQDRTASTQSVRVEEPVIPSELIMVEEWVAISAPDRGLPDKDCSKRKAEVPASSSSGDLDASSSSGDPGAPSSLGASSSRQKPHGNERGKKVHIGKSLRRLFCIAF